MAEYVRAEIATQPECWRRAAAEAAGMTSRLPRPGERVAVVGCGTSWFMAMAYAALREASGSGETHAFAASEFPVSRQYDRVVAISRSGTTTEVRDLLRALGGTSTTAIVGVEGTPVTSEADDVIVLDYADERSVVQTRFATTALALLRAHLGQDLEPVVADAAETLARPLSEFVGAEQVTFLGQGWTVGLALEAALKLREAAQMWTEAYPAMEYRHGPISIAQAGRVVWSFGPAPAGLADEVATTGATFVDTAMDPMAELVAAQRLAVAIAEARSLDPDRPRALTRSIVLNSAAVSADG